MLHPRCTASGERLKLLVTTAIDPNMPEDVLPVRHSERRALAAIALAGVLWGTSFLFGKVALRELSASYVVLGRFTLATLLLLPLVVKQWAPLRRADLPLFVLSGLLMVPVMMLLQFEGLDQTSATSAALIIGTIPVLLALAAVLFDGERLGLKGWVAVALSTLGAGVLAGIPGAGRSLQGDLLGSPRPLPLCSGCSPREGCSAGTPRS